MPRDGSGNYSLPVGYNAVTGELIQPSQHNPPLEDLANAMTNSLPRNGAASMTGPLNMADSKIINLADPVAAADAINRRTLHEQTSTMVTLGGPAGAYTLTLTSAQTLIQGLTFWAKVNATSTGGATTLVVTPGGGGSAFASKAIKILSPGTAAELNPPAGSMIAGQRYLFQYDPAANAGAGAYILVNPSSSASFRVFKNGISQTTVAGSSAWSLVTWGTETFDQGSYFSSNRWIPPEGLVMLTATITVTPVSSGFMYLSISKNASHVNNVSIRPCTGSTVLTNQVTLLDIAAPGNYYECYVMCTVGDMQIEGNSSFAGTMIRAT